MPAHATNKTNLGSIKTAIDTFESNATLATVESQAEVRALCKALRRCIVRFEDGVKGLK